MNYSNYNPLIKLAQQYSLQLATAILPIQNDNRFTGKNPSKLDVKGNPVLLKQEYKQKISDIKYQLNNYPATRLGVYLSGNILCVDIDKKHFENESQIEIALAELPETYTEKTLNGGYHLIYECMELPDYQNFKLIGVNDRSSGELLKEPHYLILAPSNGYEIVSNAPIRKIENIDELKIINPVSKNKPKISSLLTGTAKNIFTNPNINSSDRSNDLTTVTKGLHGIKNDLISKNQLQDYQDDVDRAIESTGLNLGLDNARISRISKTIEPDKCDKTPTSLKGKKAKSNIMRDKLNNYFNGELKLNIMDKHFYLDNKKITIEKLQNLAEIDLDEDFNNSKFELIVTNIADENQFNPIQEYLNSLPHITDTEVHLNNLYDILGIKNKTSTDKLYRKMIRKWLISAVARGLSPGCKADYVLVLQGKQGIGKTTFFQELFGKSSVGDPFFQTGMEARKEEDKLLAMSASWCYEYGEIEYSFSVRAIAEIKAFISKQHDTYRAPYKRSTNTYPRHFVFCGSTNEDRFLVDPTGNRRFWVIPIETKIEVSKISNIRNDVWAAILALYKAGENWYLDKEDELLVSEDTEKYAQEYIYADKIRSYFIRNKKATLSEILENALGLYTSQLIDKKIRKEVTSTLKYLGFTYKRESKRNKNGDRLYYWIAPDELKENLDIDVFDTLTVDKLEHLVATE